MKWLHSYAEFSLTILGDGLTGRNKLLYRLYIRAVQKYVDININIDIDMYHWMNSISKNYLIAKNRPNIVGMYCCNMLL